MPDSTARGPAPAAASPAVTIARAIATAATSTPMRIPSTMYATSRAPCGAKRMPGAGPIGSGGMAHDCGG